MKDGHKAERLMVGWKTVDAEEVALRKKRGADALFPQAYASAGALAALMNLRKVGPLDEPDTQAACNATEQLIDGIRNTVEE